MVSSSSLTKCPIISRHHGLRQMLLANQNVLLMESLRKLPTLTIVWMGLWSQTLAQNMIGTPSCTMTWMRKKFLMPPIFTFQLCFSFQADGKTGNVIQPKDSSITKAGGTEMTTTDKKKLAAAYGCSACGGNLYSATGGSLQGASSAPSSSCDWIVRTDSRKQVILTFSVWS